MDLLAFGGADPRRAAAFIVDSVDHYVQAITANQSEALAEIESLGRIDELTSFFRRAFLPKADARLFEIVSFVLLAEHFRGRYVFQGDSPDEVQRRELQLFRTGRTNANDGGIDFVLTPLGRFFQVTESVDFSKYFLDFEKVNRIPLTFVVKTSVSGETVKSRLRSDAVR